MRWFSIAFIAAALLLAGRTWAQDAVPHSSYIRAHSQLGLVVNAEVKPGSNAESLDYDRARNAKYSKSMPFLLHFIVAEVTLQPDGNIVYVGFAKPPGRELVLVLVVKGALHIRPGQMGYFFGTYLKTVDVAATAMIEGNLGHGPAPVFVADAYGTRMEE
jgi:hypothetical protein